MQIITKNIRWRALMETYQTAKLDHSLKNLSCDIVLMDWCQGAKIVLVFSLYLQQFS